MTFSYDRSSPSEWLVWNGSQACSAVWTVSDETGSKEEERGGNESTSHKLAEMALDPALVKLEMESYHLLPHLKKRKPDTKDNTSRLSGQSSTSPRDEVNCGEYGAKSHRFSIDLITDPSSSSHTSRESSFRVKVATLATLTPSHRPYEMVLPLCHLLRPHSMGPKPPSKDYTASCPPPHTCHKPEVCATSFENLNGETSKISDQGRNMAHRQTDHP